ncbi:MAG: hypothetical protein GY792_17690 [Gammaproteobacteria bacterium]|nr:hypothetical protein [Gammaproteobacteria bacterium]
MARMSIYVSDELKARMDRSGINWSACAQRAFELELQATDTGDGTLEAAVERLRASKQKSEQSTRPEWVQAGREWAMQEAEYGELARLSAFDTESLKHGDSEKAFSLLREIVSLIHNDEVGRHEIDGFVEELGGDARKHPSAYQLICWLEGAQEVWDEIGNEI